MNWRGAPKISPFHGTGFGEIRKRARLGWERGILDVEGDKPKWMRWRTVQRLSAVHEPYVGASLAGIAKLLGILKEGLE